MDRLETNINTTIVIGTKDIEAIYSSYSDGKDAKLNHTVKEDLMKRTRQFLDFAKNVQRIYAKGDIRNKLATHRLNANMNTVKEYSSHV